MLAKTMMGIKDTDVSKLKCDLSSYKPLEFEKWILSFKGVMKGYHPETAIYFKGVARAAEDTYQKYLR